MNKTNYQLANMFHVFETSNGSIGFKYYFNPAHYNSEDNIIYTPLGDSILYGGYDSITGLCVIENDILYITSKFNDDISRFDSYEEAIDYLESLPKWDRTTYYHVKYVFPNTFYCNTDKPLQEFRRAK